MRELYAHETLYCLNKTCANELCGAPLETLPKDQLIRFSIVKIEDDDRRERLACSKKCKKVAKFGYILKNMSETETLKAFEGMMRKKMNKKKVSM
jgi:hypothetical protein